MASLEMAVPDMELAFTYTSYAMNVVFTVTNCCVV